MYARVTPVQWADPGEREAALGRVEALLLPALRRAPGFRGYLALADRLSGRTFAISLWETAAQARRGPGDPGALHAACEALGALVEPPAVYQVLRQVADPGSGAAG